MKPQDRWDKGPLRILGPDDGASFWQPWPTLGHVTLKLWPDTFPSNRFAAGVQVLPPGGVIPEHAHRNAEELLVVLDGEGSASVDGAQQRLAPTSLVYVGRWVRHGFRNDSQRDLTLFFCIWPPGLDHALQAIGQPRRPGDPRPVVELPSDFALRMAPGGFARPDELADPAGRPVEHADRGQAIVLGPDEGDSYWQPEPTGGYATIKLSPSNLAENHLTVVVQVVPPGGVLPVHAHARNEEIKVIVTGTGTAIVEGEEVAVEPGTLLFTGRWVTHGFRNTGDQPLTILAVFSPPDLEGILAGIGTPRRVGEPRPPSVPWPHDVDAILGRHSLVVPAPPRDF